MSKKFWLRKQAGDAECGKAENVNNIKETPFPFFVGLEFGSGLKAIGFKRNGLMRQFIMMIRLFVV
jgi:hypothetical protein